MFLMFLTFVVVLAALGILFWIGFQRIALHLKGNPDATKAVVEHVLIPLFGRRQEAEADETVRSFGRSSYEQDDET